MHGITPIEPSISLLVEAYWNVGKMIVEEEQQGKAAAGYGEALIRNLSERLTNDFGKGFNISNVFAFRQFYLAFSKFRAVRGTSLNYGQDTRNPTSILWHGPKQCSMFTPASVFPAALLLHTAVEGY
jgi:hypothetical protein